jgi:hypothetical protein
MDAARVEVLHREVVLALHHADDGERVRKVGVLVDGTLDQEPATFEPLEGGPPANHRVFHHRVGHLGRPLADQRLERLQLRPRVGLVHSTPSSALRGDIALSLPAIGGRARAPRSPYDPIAERSDAASRERKSRIERRGDVRLKLAAHGQERVRGETFSPMLGMAWSPARISGQRQHHRRLPRGRRRERLTSHGRAARSAVI